MGVGVSYQGSAKTTRVLVVGDYFVLVLVKEITRDDVGHTLLQVSPPNNHNLTSLNTDLQVVVEH